MKKLLIIIISVFITVGFCSCGNDSEITVDDGMKLAGAQAGNGAVAYSFTYPEEWEMVRNDGVIEIQYDCDDSALVARYATITVLAFDSDLSAKEYWTTRENEHKELFKDYTLIETQEYDTQEEYIDDAPAYGVKYSGVINETTYISDQIICSRYGTIYLITLVACDSDYESVSNVLGSVTENFVFE